MKKIGFTLIYLLMCANISAQFLGQEVKVEKISTALDSFKITAYRYHDLTEGVIEDSISVYMNTTVNAPMFKRNLIKKSQTFLYDSIYYVVYEREIQTFLFAEPTEVDGKIFFDERIDDKSFMNCARGEIRLSRVARWYFFPGNGFLGYDTPVFNHPQFSFYLSNGKIKHDASVTLHHIPFDYDLTNLSTLHTYPPEISIDSITGVLSVDTTLTGKYLVQIMAKNGFRAIKRTMVIDVDKLKYQLTTNTVSRQKPTLNMVLFPNPTQNQLILSTENPLDEIRIYNQLGQLMQQESSISTNQVSIDVSGFSSGIYVVQVRRGSVWQSERFVKE